MPVMVLYKEKSIDLVVTEELMQAVAGVTDKELSAKIEVRVIEPVQTFNANGLHLEMRFRELNEWTDSEL
jgi:hypothetical protein